MINKILILTLMIFLIGNVSATTYTQQEINSIDARTYNLQCQRESLGNPNYRIINNRFFIAFSCLDIKRISVGVYEVERKTFYPNFLLSDYNYCLTNFTEQECITQFTGVLQSQISLKKTMIRERIVKMQTPTATAPTGFDNINLQ